MNRAKNRNIRTSRGYVLLPAVIVFSTGVLGLTALFISPINATYGLVRQRIRIQSALHLAEAGVQKALCEIELAGPDYSGNGSLTLPTGEVVWRVVNAGAGKIAVSAAGRPNLCGVEKEMAAAQVMVSASARAEGGAKVEIISVRRITGE